MTFASATAISSFADIKKHEAKVVKPLTERTALLVYTAKVASAHASRHSLNTQELSALIQTLYDTFQILRPGTEEDIKKPIPAVSPKRSVFADYIICLEDGKKLKMLKRHLKSAYNMTTDEYRRKWGLPADYPMVARNVAKPSLRLLDGAAHVDTNRRSNSSN